MTEQVCAPPETVVARQPILDRHERVGYELLYRPTAASEDGDESDNIGMTSRTVVASVLEFGLDHLVGTAQAWFNVSADFLFADYHLALPAKRVVLELLETEEPTDELRDAIKRSRKLGYSVALDDYSMGSSHEVLLDVADYVKVDLLYPGAFELIETLVGQGHVVVAEKVETKEDEAKARAAGATLFQGYFFAKPTLERRSRMSSAMIAGFQLIANLTDEDLPFERMVEIVTADPALATRMLIAANSSFVGLQRKVKSIHEVVLFLGSQRVRRMALLCVLDNLRGSLPRELLRLALTRAELCKGVMVMTDRRMDDAAYTCGLLSVLDALTGQKMDNELLKELGLDPLLVKALVLREGPLGGALTAAITILDDPEEAMSDQFNGIYRNACRTADRILDGIESAT